MNTKWLDRLVGPVLALVALGVYLLTLSSGAFPEASSTLIVSVLGLFPTLAPSSPLWMLAARGLVGAVGADHAVQALNLFSALCAAGAVWLLYSLMRHGIFFFTDEYLVSLARRRWASILAGIAAALFLAFCLPFWNVANRAHYAAFDILLLLLLARLFVAYAAHGHPLVAITLALLYGVGLAEFATLIVLGPVFGGGLLYVMWKRETLRGWLLAGLAGSFLIGLLLSYTGAAWAFHETPGYAIRGYKSFVQILHFMGRDQYFLITRSLPREGWLIILFVTVVPWLTMFAVARRALNDEHEWSINILHVTMTALVVAVALNVKLAPWAMLGWSRLLVTPYVLAAMVFGYLAAFWFLLPGERQDAVWAFDMDWIRRMASRAVLLGLLGVVLYVPWRNREGADTAAAGPANALADKVVGSLAGRTWLLTDGRLDNHLLLAARRRQVPLRVLNMQGGDRLLHQNYVASLFEDVRLKNLATLSLSALLREWLTPGQGVASQVAILGTPDVWLRQGFQAVPNQLVFLGSEDIKAEDGRALLARHEAFWKDFEPWLKDNEASPTTASADGVRRKSWVTVHASMVANNLGVLLEDLELPAEAARAYAAARRLEPDNVSALLNTASMVQAGRAQDPDGAIQKALAELEKGLEKKYHIWSLSRYYGTVRAPEAFAQLGWNWAYSGRPEMAIAQMEKAVDLLPEAQRETLQGVMADLYLQDNRPLEGEAIYKTILSREPGNLPALQGMMRISLLKRDLGAAEAYRSKSAENGLDPVQAVLQQVLIETAGKQFDAARQRLEALLQEDRKLLRGWVLLAEIGFASGNASLIDQALRRLEGVEGARGFNSAIIQGRRAFDKKDLQAAVAFFEAALVHQPGNRRLIETLLRLDLVLGRADSIRRYVKQLLQEDPGHALALYVRGSLQIANGDYTLAEDSLRQSLKRARLPMALNDLAWLRMEQGALVEAEGLINEALAANERNPAAWDTKGVILLKSGRAEEAEQAFGRAIAMAGGNATMHLHMGEAQLALGKLEALRKIIEMLAPHREQLQPNDRELFNRLQAALK